MNPNPARRFLQPFAAWAAARGLAGLHVVGGCLRDELIGVPPSARAPNLDVATPRDALRIARDFARHAGGAFVPLDEALGLARVVWREQGASAELDLADWRAPDLAGDLALRDFTVNAMAAPLEGYVRGEPLGRILLDPQGGRTDLAARRLRAVYPRAFLDDGARLLRGAALAARLDCTIDEPTLALMRSSAPAIDGIAGERVCETIFQLLGSRRAARGLEQLDALGILERLVPEITPCRGVSQGGHHHLDVWAHSLETVRQLERLLEQPPWPERLRAPLMAFLDTPVAGERPRYALLKWAALCHDFGKPTKRRVDETGRVWFTGHERVGAEMVEMIAGRLKLSVRETETLARMILAHLRPGDLTRMEVLTRRAVFRFFRDLAEEGPSVLIVWLADRAATRGPTSAENRLDHQQAVVVELLEHYFLKPQEVVRMARLVDGHALMQALGLPPGPAVGDLLRRLDEAQAEGQIHTTAEALALARRWQSPA